MSVCATPRIANFSNYYPYPLYHPVFIDISYKQITEQLKLTESYPDSFHQQTRDHSYHVEWVPYRI